MSDYFDSSKGGDIDHGNRIYIKSRHGYIIAVRMRVKVMPDITSSVDVASLMLPIHRKDRLDDMPHDVILIDSENGNVLGATESCLSSFGIPYSLCYGNTKRNAILNITQIFPKIQSIADIKAMKNDSLLSLLDTSMIPSIFSFEWNADQASYHRSHGRFSMHTTKARLEYFSGNKSPNKENTDIIVIELMKAGALEKMIGNIPASGVFTPTSNIDMTPNMDASQQEVILPERGQSIKRGFMVDVFSRRASLNKSRSSKGSRDQKSQTEEEVQAMVAHQEKIRRLKEKRAMIDAPATTSEMFIFKSSIYLMTALVTVWLSVNTILCHRMADLMTSSTSSLINLSERAAVIPILARDFRLFNLLLKGTLSTTPAYNTSSIISSMNMHLQTLKAKEAVTEVFSLSISSQLISVVDEYEDYHLQDLTGKQQTMPMYIQHAIYEFVNAVELANDSTSPVDILDHMARGFHFVSRNFGTVFKRVLAKQTEDFLSGVTMEAEMNMRVLIWMSVGCVAGCLGLGCLVLFTLLRIARNLNSLHDVISALKVSDVVKMLAQVKDFEGVLRHSNSVGINGDSDSEPSESFQQPAILEEEVKQLRSEIGEPISPLSPSFSPSSKKTFLNNYSSSPKNQTIPLRLPDPKILKNLKTIKSKNLKETIESVHKSLERNLSTTARVIARKLKITSGLSNKKSNKLVLFAKPAIDHDKSSKSHNDIQKSRINSMSLDKSSKDMKDLTDIRVVIVNTQKLSGFFSLLGWITALCVFISWPTIAGAMIQSNQVFNRISPVLNEANALNKLQTSMVYLNSYLLENVVKDNPILTDQGIY